MGPFFGPLHLLFLAESFADHFIHCRFHKSRRDRLAMTVPLTVIRDHVPVVHNIGAQLRQRLEQLREPSIGLVKGLDRGLQIVDLAQRFVDLPMPQRPFETLDLVAYRLTQHGFTPHQAFAILAQYRQFHREVKPVQLSLSRLNHWLPWGQAHPEVVQSTTEFHDQIADAFFPQTNAVFDDATPFHTAIELVASFAERCNSLKYEEKMLAEAACPSLRYLSKIRRPHAHFIQHAASACRVFF